MCKLIQGSTIEMISGEWNTYKVLEACDSFALLQCNSFIDKEDLGDGIFCTELNQEIWIAQFHAPFFKLSDMPRHHVTTVKTNLKHC